jgi:hypothetical protein
MRALTPSPTQQLGQALSLPPTPPSSSRPSLLQRALSACLQHRALVRASSIIIEPLANKAGCGVEIHGGALPNRHSRRGQITAPPARISPRHLTLWLPLTTQSSAEHCGARRRHAGRRRHNPPRRATPEGEPLVKVDSWDPTTRPLTMPFEGRGSAWGHGGDCPGLPRIAHIEHRESFAPKGEVTRG